MPCIVRHPPTPRTNDCNIFFSLTANSNFDPFHKQWTNAPITCGFKNSKQCLHRDQPQVWLKSKKSEQKKLLQDNLTLERFIHGSTLKSQSLERHEGPGEKFFNALQSMSPAMILTVTHNNGLDRVKVTWSCCDTLSQFSPSQPDLSLLTVVVHSSVECIL